MFLFCDRIYSLWWNKDMDEHLFVLNLREATRTRSNILLLHSPYAKVFADILVRVFGKSIKTLALSTRSATLHWNRHSVVTTCNFLHCAVTGFPNFPFTFRSIGCIHSRKKIHFSVWAWTLTYDLDLDLDLDRVKMNQHVKYLQVKRSLSSNVYIRTRTPSFTHTHTHAVRTR